MTVPVQTGILSAMNAITENRSAPAANAPGGETQVRRY